MPSKEFTKKFSQVKRDDSDRVRTVGDAAERGMVLDIQAPQEFLRDLTGFRQEIIRVGSAFESYLRRFQAKWRNIDRSLLAKADQAVEGYKYAAKHPDLDKSRLWLRLQHTNVWDAAVFAPYVPDPRKRRGRPRGSSPAAANIARMQRMDELIHQGFTSTKAARQVLKECGVRGELKNKADYLVKLYRPYIAEKNRGN